MTTGVLMYEFHETVELEIPNVSSKFAGFQESETKKGLVIEVAAIHEGMTANHNFYSASELAESISSWVMPYPKPIIRNHDISDEAIGRVIAAKMDVEEDGTPYSRLQIAITDPTAIEKVLDERYLTGSVGGKAGEALCSVCNSNWSEASAYKSGCKHVRGKTYTVEGKEHKAHLKMGKLSFKEYSIVNAPADSRSGVRAMTTDTDSVKSKESDGWVTSPARIFSINMDKEEILEYTESEDRNILSTMKKKDASPLYLGIKGAFLSALAVQEFEEDTMAEEDILAISEELSADLAATSSEVETVSEEEVEEASEEKKTHPFQSDPKVGNSCAACGAPEDDENHDDDDDDDDAEDDSDDATLNKDDGAESEETTTDEVVEEGSLFGNSPPTVDDTHINHNNVNRPQAQAKRHGQDINSETSANAPINRQSADMEDGEELSENSEEVELNETTKALELRIEELEAREQTLSEENARLKTALKGSLVERVVDTKVSLGMVSQEEREESIHEHMERSAVSLADTLRDLAQMVPAAIDYSGVPRVESQGNGIPIDNRKDGLNEKVLTIDTMEFETGSKKDINAEEFFTDALMGRKKL